MNRYFLSVVLLLVFSANSFSADTPQQQKLLADGEAALAKENYLEAIGAYEKYLSEPPQDKVDYALFTLGKAKSKLAGSTRTRIECTPPSRFECSTTTFAQIQYVERYPQDFSPMGCCDGHVYSNKEFKRLETEFPHSPYTGEGAVYLKESETLSADPEMMSVIDYINAERKYLALYPEASWSSDAMKRVLCMYSNFLSGVEDGTEPISYDWRREVRMQANQFYAESLPYLKKSLSGTDNAKKMNALSGLECMLPIPDDLVPSVRLLLKDASKEIRGQSWKVLSLAARNNIPALKRTMESSSDMDRVEAATTLYSIQLSSETVMPVLQDCLHSTDTVVQQKALRVMEMVATSSHLVVPSAISALHDRNKDIRKNAARLLGILGRDSEEAKSALREAMNNPASGIVSEAKRALEKISPKDFEEASSSEASETIEVTIDPSGTAPGSIKHYRLDESGEKTEVDE